MSTVVPLPPAPEEAPLDLSLEAEPSRGSGEVLTSTPAHSMPGSMDGVGLCRRFMGFGGTVRMLGTVSRRGYVQGLMESERICTRILIKAVWKSCKRVYGRCG